MNHEMPQETVTNTSKKAGVADVPVTTNAESDQGDEVIEDELPELEEDEAVRIIVLDEHDKSGGPDAASDDDEEMEEKGSFAENGDNSEFLQNPISSRDDAVLVLREHTSETLAIAASPVNRNQIITGGMDDVGLIWDLAFQRSVAKVDGGKDSVSTVAFSHDGMLAAFGSENGVISIVYMDGEEVPGKPLDGPGDTIHFLSWHPRGPVLLAGSADSVAYMWNAAKRSFMMAFAGHEKAVSCGCFTADGKLVVTGSLDSSVRVWSPTTGSTIVRIQRGMDGLRGAFHSAGIHCLDVGSLGTSASNLVVSGCAGGDVFVCHRESGHVVVALPRHEGGVETVAFSPSQMRPVLVASAGADGVIRIWDIEVNAERCKFSHDGIIAKLVWHPSLPVLVSGSSDGTVALWDVLSGQQLNKFEGHQAFISDVCFAGNNDFIASTSGDGTVRIFDARSYLSAVK